MNTLRIVWAAFRRGFDRGRRRTVEVHLELDTTAFDAAMKRFAANSPCVSGRVRLDTRVTMVTVTIT